MNEMNLSRRAAEKELSIAKKKNPGFWVAHSKNVAWACAEIARRWFSYTRRRICRKIA